MMNFLRLYAFAGILLLGACSSVTSPSEVSFKSSIAGQKIYTPTEAIVRAAEAAPESVSGVFELEITSAGEQDGNVYLNSELDYRDQRNLTISIYPEQQKQFKAKYSEDPLIYFIGKRIKVRGKANRVKIYFIVNGARTHKYYYQTHVKLNSVEDFIIF